MNLDKNNHQINSFAAKFPSNLKPPTNETSRKILRQELGKPRNDRHAHEAKRAPRRA